MTHSYVAYIDEAGDEGLSKFRQPGAEGGSSNWLIISACVIRSSRDLDAVAWRDEIVKKMGGQKRQIHFQDMTHAQRTMAAQVLATKGVRICHVIADKRPIPAGIYKDRNQLYFYLTRYLLERVSWLCRDFRPKVPEGDGKVKIVFSRRGKMSYNDFRDYLLRLKGDPEARIHWPVIDIDGIEALDHSRRAGLQLADIAASSFGAALELDKYGNCETRYAESLKRIIYEREGNYFSYGVKFFPAWEKCQLTDQQSRLIDIYK